VVAAHHVGALNDMLNAALVFGTGRGAALPLHPACGKTGTAQDFRDAWFIGYTAHFVAGAWVGNDDRRPMKRVAGGTLPAKLWREVMLLAHEGKTPMPLPGTVPVSPMAMGSIGAVGSDPAALTPRQ
jgi:penicillin-binding protein 1A